MLVLVCLYSHFTTYAYNWVLIEHERDVRGGDPEV